MHHRGWVSLIVTLALLALGACSGGSSSTSAMPSGQDSALSGDQSAPSLTELQAMLAAEFERLGIDPDKVTAQAPRKDENAVFDLTAELVDPDGTGGEAPTGITLTWTERIIADYNQDGMVTQNDLTPIGQNYCFDSTTAQVGYDDPADHGGFDQWPGGDPDDGESGSLNWRLARIDGNGDGYILQYDITPIAVHWEERLTGYRLYRLAPGEIQYNLVGLIEADRNGTDPVRYSYDNTIEAQGYHSFYVRPYDETSGTEGPASGIVTIDTASGIVNQSPVARLTVNPDFAGAPAVITLDATGSYDLDGEVVGYAWDFDGDGTTDWVTGEAVPEQSSDGTVQGIIPVSDGVVEVTYTSGSADWKFPGVAAIDNESTQSLFAEVKLGISGWDYCPLIESTTNYESVHVPELLEVDPNTGRYVYASSNIHPEIPEWSPVLAMVHQNADSSWEDEIIDAPFWEEDADQSVKVRDVVWDEYNQPILLLNYRNSMNFWAWVAHRQTDGTWEFFQVEPPEYPAEPSRIVLYPASQFEQGRFAFLVREKLGDKPNLAGTMTFHFRYSVMFYDHGTWSIEYTGNDSADTLDIVDSLLGSNPANLRVLMEVHGNLTSGPWWGGWESGTGIVNLERLDDYAVHMGIPTSCYSSLRQEDGTVVSLWEDQSYPAHLDFWLLLTNEDGTEAYEMNDISLLPDYEARDVTGLYSGSRGVGMFIHLNDSGGAELKNIAEHYRLETDGWLVEEITCPSEVSVGPWVEDTTALQNGEPSVLFSRLNGDADSDINYSYFIGERLDPRL